MKIRACGARKRSGVGRLDAAGRGAGDRADNVGRVQRRDVGRAIAQLGEQLIGMLAQRGRIGAQRQAPSALASGSSGVVVPRPSGSVTGASPPVARKCGSSNRSCGRVIGA